MSAIHALHQLSAPACRVFAVCTFSRVALPALRAVDVPPARAFLVSARVLVSALRVRFSEVGCDADVLCAAADVALSQKLGEEI